MKPTKFNTIANLVRPNNVYRRTRHEEHQRKMHRRNLRAMKPSIDTRTPETFIKAKKARKRRKAPLFGVSPGKSLLLFTRPGGTTASAVSRSPENASVRERAEERGVWCGFKPGV